MISRMIAPLTPLTAKIDAASDQVIRAQNINIIAVNLQNAKRPGALYTHRTQLSAELNDFVAVHRGLLYGDASRGLSAAMSNDVRELLFDPDNGLDRFARDFEDQVRKGFLSDSLTVKDDLAVNLQDITELELSPRLQEFTGLLAQEARIAVSKTYAAQVSLIAITVLLMMMLGRCLYRPLADKIVGVLNNDNTSRDKNALRFDEVTGLANRTYLLSFMTDLCKFSQQHDFKSAVLDIEVNGLDAVASVLEPQDVNEMKSMIARRLESVCRSGDFIAKVSGNEFVVVLTSFEDDTALNDITNALRTKLSLPFVLATHSFGLKTKIGIKIADRSDSVPAAILNQAATALKIAKASDNYDIQFFSGSLAPKANQREKEFQQIERGLKNVEFCAHFQPIVDLESGAALGLEALVRWNHPKRGNLSPIHFMETVKNRGLSNDVTRAVLGDALRALREWRSQSIDVPYVSINLDVEQMEDKTFVDELKWIVDSYNQSPSAIAFEFPEAAFMPSNATHISENIERLGNYGFRIILDDFGTLGLKLQDINTIKLELVKIDRAFITNINSETVQQTTTLDMIKQAQANQTLVVAEGVETPAERATLQRMNADAIQGYLVCEPVDMEAVFDWLKSSANREPEAQSA